MIGIPDQKNPNRYTFHASEPECYYQLFKYGPQAVIIEPLEIKEHFIQLYEATVRTYKK
jgi:predicted DNA-binding transcriptional regulator YafY